MDLERKMFHKLKKRYKFKGTLTTNSGLHIGAGDSNQIIGTDSPVVKDFYGRPYIPASSFKGILRSAVERVINGLNRKDFYCCDIMSSPCTGEINTDSLDETKKAVLCKGCLLFGSLEMASRIMIKDLSLKDHSLWFNELFEVRDGVAIERDTETAKDGGKFDYEVVPAGTEFSLEVIMENPDPYEIGLFLLGIREMNEGFALLGGNTSRGLGRIYIEWDEISEQDAYQIIKNNSVKYIKEKRKEELQEKKTESKEKKPLLVKPDISNPFLCLAYIIKKIEQEGKISDRDAIGELLKEEFGLTNKKRVELELPRKLTKFIKKYIDEKKISLEGNIYSLKVEVDLSGGTKEPETEALEKEEKEYTKKEKSISDFVEFYRKALVKKIEGGENNA